MFYRFNKSGEFDFEIDLPSGITEVCFGNMSDVITNNADAYKELKNYDVGLFFYAGHGVQAKGINYLIPIDAALKTENDVEYNCVDAGRILAKMEDASTSTNIVILDLSSLAYPSKT